MSDRAVTGHTNTTGPQAYDSEIEYWVSQKGTKRMLKGRIKGLFAAELVEWVANCPDNTELIKWLDMQKTNTEIEKEGWAKALTRANRDTFETFVDRETKTDWLNSIIEAEAERDDPRGERIGYVNQRKQQL